MDISSHGATLTWQGPAYDGGCIVTGYKVEMCKVSLLSISQDGFWRTLTDLCKVSQSNDPLIYLNLQAQAQSLFEYIISAVTYCSTSLYCVLAEPLSVMLILFYRSI